MAFLNFHFLFFIFPVRISMPNNLLPLSPLSHPLNLSQPEAIESYTQKFVVYSLLWSFTGDAKLSVRNELGEFLRSCSTIQMPSGSTPLIDYEVCYDIVTTM